MTENTNMSNTTRAGKQGRVCVTFLATEDELAGVDALSCDEQLRPFLEPVRVAEDHLGEWSSAAGVVDDVLRERERRPLRLALSLKQVMVYGIKASPSQSP